MLGISLACSFLWSVTTGATAITLTGTTANTMDRAVTNAFVQGSHLLLLTSSTIHT